MTELRNYSGARRLQSTSQLLTSCFGGAGKDQGWEHQERAPPRPLLVRSLRMASGVIRQSLKTASILQCRSWLLRPRRHAASSVTRHFPCTASRFTQFRARGAQRATPSVSRWQLPCPFRHKWFDALTPSVQGSQWPKREAWDPCLISGLNPTWGESPKQKNRRPNTCPLAQKTFRKSIPKNTEK